MSLSGSDDRLVAERRRTWWREPLLHFVFLGGLAFLAHRVLFGAPPSEYIASENAPVEQIRQDWFAAKGTLPDAQQEAALVQEWVEDEILYRRAIELGLDQNDTVVRRRLVQRMRFFIEDTSRIEPPTDTQLRAWLERHPDRFAMPAKTSFTHLFFSRGRRGPELGPSAVAALESLKRDPRAEVDSDRFFRGNAFEDATLMEIKRAFGAEFAESIEDVALGQWTGPLKSSYGLHLVFVNHRVAGAAPELDATREKVEQDWLQSERARRNREALAKLRARYAPEGQR
jgi:peptidyl-prolyl cis-trans isomerase C